MRKSSDTYVVHHSMPDSRISPSIVAKLFSGSAKQTIDEFETVTALLSMNTST